jgi:hypothetical protein
VSYKLFAPTGLGFCGRFTEGIGQRNDKPPSGRFPEEAMIAKSLGHSGLRYQLRFMIPEKDVGNDKGFSQVNPARKNAETVLTVFWAPAVTDALPRDPVSHCFWMRTVHNQPRVQENRTWTNQARI